MWFFSKQKSYKLIYCVLEMQAIKSKWPHFFRATVYSILVHVQGSINAVRKSCGCLLVTSVANYKVRASSLTCGYYGN